MRKVPVHFGLILAALFTCFVSATAIASNELFYSCQSCHEPDGSGNEAIGAPAIAGMDAQYLATQMRKFRDGIRGASIDDLPGRQMNLIASLITDDNEIDAIAQYVANMDRPPVKNTSMSGSDAGANLFVACAACHGEAGEGKTELNAPAINGFGDWYVRSQLLRFRDGSRGGHPDDHSGAQMRLASAGLSDEDIRVLSAYAATLDQQIRKSQ